jgi:SAM-dependent methyltransferase
MRGLDLASLREMELFTFVFGEESPTFGLVADRIVFAALRIPRSVILTTLEKALFAEAASRAIVEFGSGTGRNLIWLARSHPECAFVGFDLSPVSVELANAAAHKFNLVNVVFYAADVCGVMDVPLRSADVVYSVHALEQMPRIFGRAVENMLKLAPRAVLLEPVAELYPVNLRGLLARLRIRYLDRLNGLIPFLSDRGWLADARRLGSGDHPLNETCLILVERPTNPDYS